MNKFNFNYNPEIRYVKGQAAGNAAALYAGYKLAVEQGIATPENVKRFNEYIDRGERVISMERLLGCTREFTQFEIFSLGFDSLATELISTGTRYEI